MKTYTNNIEFFTVKQLINKKIHLGHLTKDWNPSLAIVLYGSRNNIHFIDLQQTIFLFRRALNFLYSSQKYNYKIAFCEKVLKPYQINYKVNLDKRIKYDNLLSAYAKHYNQFYINKNIRGGLFNAIKQLRTNNDRSNNLIIPKNSKLFPNILFISNLEFFKSILFEVNKINLISIGLVDTNNSFSKLTYPIPCNDDNNSSISFFNQLIIKSLDTSSLLFDNNYLHKTRSKLINKYSNLFSN